MASEDHLAKNPAPPVLAWPMGAQGESRVLVSICAATDVASLANGAAVTLELLWCTDSGEVGDNGAAASTLEASSAGELDD